MQYADFEKHAKQTFAFDVDYVDTEMLLANLSLGQKPKRKFPLFWILGSVITLGALLSGFYFWPATAPSDFSSLAESSSALTTSSKEPSSQGLILDEVEREESNSKLDDNGGQNLQLNINTNLVNPKSNTSEEAITKTYSPSSEKTELNASSRITKRAISNSTENAMTSPIIENDLPAPFTTDSEDADNLTPIISKTRSLISVSTLSTSSLLAFDENIRDLELGDPIKCPTFKEGNGLHFDLIPELGYMFADKSLSDENPESSLITSIRRDEERALEGLQAALYGRASMDNLPFYVKAGISYTRISERLALEYDYIESDTTIGIISISSNPAGDTITTVMGPIVTDTQFTGNTTKHYYLHQWDLPIAIGYERPIGGFMLGVEGGLHFNLRTSVSGNILDTQDQFREAERGRDIKRRVGLGYFGGVSVGKYIPRFGDVYLAARARFVPDVSDDNALTKQSYMLYGLHAGYVYRF